LDNEDGGIVFTARTASPESSSSHPLNGSPVGGQSSHAPVTATESTLPWRRSSSKDESSSAQAIRQEEFPPWIDNKDYVPYYASPTNTYLGKLDQTKGSGNLNINNNQTQRTPTVYEIFTIVETGENPGRSDSGSSASSKDNNQSESVTKGRFQCTSASSDDNISNNQQTSPTVALNLAFESDDINAPTIYKL